MWDERPLQNTNIAPPPCYRTFAVPPARPTDRAAPPDCRPGGERRGGVRAAPGAGAGRDTPPPKGRLPTRPGAPLARLEAIDLAYPGTSTPSLLRAQVRLWPAWKLSSQYRPGAPTPFRFSDVQVRIAEAPALLLDTCECNTLTSCRAF